MFRIKTVTDKNRASSRRVETSVVILFYRDSIYCGHVSVTDSAKWPNRNFV